MWCECCAKGVYYWQYYKPWPLTEWCKLNVICLLQQFSVTAQNDTGCSIVIRKPCHPNSSLARKIASISNNASVANKTVGPTVSITPTTTKHKSFSAQAPSSGSADGRLFVMATRMLVINRFN